MKKSLAIIGIRGIPVVYSGFETFAEELSTRLVKRGWRVRVYGRKHVIGEGYKEYKGAEVAIKPSISTKNLDTITHSLICTVHACFSNPRPAIIYYLGVGSSVCSFLPRMFGIKTVVNVDGLDWKRGKWGRVARLFLLVSEQIALYFANLTITDSLFIQKYYLKKYRRGIPMIPYGYSKTAGKELHLRKYNLKKMKYIVWSGRLVPDNHLDELINAYIVAKINMPLIVLGDAPKNDPYKQKLLAQAKGNRNIRFLGFVERANYASLIGASLAYIETKRSGGTHPSLVESMGHGCMIVANDHQSHKEVLGNTAIFYPAGNENELGMLLKKIVRKSFDSQRHQFALKTKKRAEAKYSWEAVVAEYEKLFGAMLS